MTLPAPLVLLDGASMWFRSFFGVPSSITAPDGRPVNAVRGFFDAVATVITQQRPGRLVVCLDLDWRPQWRVDLIPSYKAHRVEEETAGDEPDVEEVPDDLTPQVDMIMELLDAFGIATGGAPGFEADDVLGTLAAQERRDPVVVVSGDRDLLQVVTDDPVPVRVLYIGRGLAKATLFGPAEVAERYGLPAGRAGAAYAELALLRGDPSDGLPGVAGIGEKTAAGAAVPARLARRHPRFRRGSEIRCRQRCSGQVGRGGRLPGSRTARWFGWPRTPPSRCRRRLTHCRFPRPTRSGSPSWPPRTAWVRRSAGCRRRWTHWTDAGVKRTGIERMPFISVRAHPLDGPGQFEVLHPGEHLGNDRGGLHPGEVRAEAEMRAAAAERQMRVRRRDRCRSGRDRRSALSSRLADG